MKKLFLNQLESAELETYKTIYKKMLSLDGIEFTEERWNEFTNEKIVDIECVIGQYENDYNITLK